MVQIGAEIRTAGWFKLNLCVDLISFEVVAVVIAVDEAQVSAFAVWNEASCNAGHALDQLPHGLHSCSNHVALVVVDFSAHGTAIVCGRLSHCQLTGIMGEHTTIEDGLIQCHPDESFDLLWLSQVVSWVVFELDGLFGHLLQIVITRGEELAEVAVSNVVLDSFFEVIDCLGVANLLVSRVSRVIIMVEASHLLEPAADLAETSRCDTG